MRLNFKPSRVFYGWWIVAACFLIQLCAGGIVFYGFTAIFEPLSKEFGWSYAQISLAASLRGLEETISAPLWGFLADRLGSRKLIFFGSIIASLGLASLSQTQSLTRFYLSFVLVAMGMGACSITVLITAVANWFHKKLGLATGIVMCGFGSGGLMVPVVARLIDVMGWRTAMLVLSLIVLGMIMPLSMVFRRRPEQHGLLPDGAVGSAESTAGSTVSVPLPEARNGVRGALRTPAFWQISLAITCQFIVVGAVMTHIMPFLSTVGVARGTASLAASAVPVVSIIGRFSLGWFSDRVDNRWLMAVDFAMMAAGMLFFAYVSASTLWLLVPFLILFANGYGGNNTVRASLLRKHFGKSNYGSIFGFMMGIGMAGHIIGAPVAGWVYDTWGNYQGAWLAFIGVLLIALVLVATIRPLAPAEATPKIQSASQ